MTQSTAFFPLGGGLDLVTPEIAQKPGRVKACLNYEPFSSGYRRLRGFERYDSSPAPSEATGIGADTEAARRATIMPVPGTGPVRGIHFFDDELYAFRDFNTAEARMYRAAGAANPDGWAREGVSYLVNFSAGAVEPTGLPTFYDNASGAGGTLGTLQKVVKTSGDWAAGTAAGYAILGSNPAWISGDNIYRNSSATTTRVFTLTSAPSAITFTDGGRFECLTYNFYATTSLSRMYGCNGANRAFEFDGTVITPIFIPGLLTADDKPEHLAVHRNSLFLSLAAGTLAFSEVGEPLHYDAVLGAGEIGTGARPVALVENVSVLTTLTERSILNLYGNDSSDYLLEVFNPEAGGLEWTAQRLGSVYYMDNSGVRSLQTAQAFGNFKMGTITQLVQPLIEDYRRDGVEPTASAISRRKDQYWLFFDNGEGLVIHLGKKEPEIMRFNLGKVVRCTCSFEDEGQERFFFGSDDGYVYELDKGTNFDGAAIEHYVRLPFNHFGSPQQKKRAHKVTLEMEAIGSTTIQASVDFDYGKEAGTAPQTLVVSSGGGAIDDSGQNELYYSSQIETTAEIYVDGVANNFSLKIAGSTTTEQPHVLQGMTWHISGRGKSR